MALTKIPAGLLDKSAHVDFADNEQIRLGNTQGLLIYHSGTHSHVRNTSSGNLYLQDEGYVEIGSPSGEVYIGAIKDGAVNLRYDNVKKFETTSGGASVTGNLAVSGNLTVSGTTTELDTTNLNVTDKNITLNYHASSDTSSNADGAGITIQDAVNGSTDATLNWSASNDRFVMSHGLEVTSGNVGIGTTIPNTKLHVNSTSQGNFVEGIRLENSGGGANEGAYIQWEIANSSGYGPRIGGRREGTGGMGLHFYTGEINAAPTEKMRIDHDGNVVIGTTTNSYLKGKLTVHTTPGVPATSGTSIANVGFRLGTTTGNSQVMDMGVYNASPYGAWIQVSGAGNMASTTPLILNPNGGNVGIGTTIPGTLLELRADTASGSYGVYPALSIRNDNAAGYGAIHFNEGGTQRARVEVGNNSGTPYMGLYTTSGSSGITIKDGNVGIGTTNPGAPLNVSIAAIAAGTDLQKQGIAVTTPFTSGYQNQSSGLLSGYDGTLHGTAIGMAYENPGYALTFFTNDNTSGLPIERMRINDNGRIGIGTNQPGAPLAIISNNAGHPSNYATVWAKNTDTTGNAFAGYVADGHLQSHYRYYIQGALKWQTRVGAGNGVDDFRIYSWTKGDDVLTILNSGYVGIGDSSPGHKLEVKSTDNYKAIHIKGTNAPCYTMARGDGTDAEWRMGLSGYDYNDFAISSGTGTNDRLRIDPDGNMILGSANNVTPRDLHNVSATVSVSGPIASGYTMGTYSTGPMNVRDWFVYAGPPSGQSRYVHMKTDLWAGGSPNGNVEYTMSVFRYHTAYSYGNAKVSEGMIGWHNWSGSTAHQRIIHNPVSNWAIVKESYTSSDGYVVLVADILASGSYTQFSIDWFQWAGYPFRERKVTAVTLNTNATGAY